MGNYTMKSKNHLSLLVSASVCASALLYLPSVNAAPGVLSEKPLSLVVTTKPNILLILDDSGSMDSDSVILNSVSTAHGGTISPTNNNTDLKRVSAVDDFELFGLCNGYNSLAFNPEIEYTKWQDYTGKTFVDYSTKTTFDIEKIISNPFQSSTETSLSKDFYIRWDDDPGDNDESVGKYTFDLDKNEGECGPGVAAYDRAFTDSKALFASGPNGEVVIDDETFNKSGLFFGTFTDSNSAGGGNYRAEDNGVVIINVPGATGGKLIFDITKFNVDNGDSDSLTVYGGYNATSLADDDLAPNAITVTKQFNAEEESVLAATQMKDGVLKYRPRSDPFKYVADQVTSKLVLDDDVSKNFTREISQFTVDGTSATLVFDGGSDTGTREGFIISWRYDDGSGTSIGAEGNGIVDIDDCDRLNCVSVASLPESEQDAIDAGLPPYNTQRNYANWFTYYRTRLPVAQKALANIVYNSDYRIGFTTLNDTGYGGALINNMENLADGTINDAKKGLMEKVYATRTVAKVDAVNDDSSPKFNDDGSRAKAFADGTQLIKALSNAGRYFTEGKDSESDFFGTTAEGASIESTHVDEAGLTVSKSPIFANEYGGECQQNFTLLFTDGEWGDRVSDYLNTDHDVNGSASGFVGDYDKGVEYGGGVYGDGGLNLDGTGGIEDTLADVAMYYFANDLAPDVRDSLNLDLHGDVITHQHMVTFGVGFGVTGGMGSTPSDFDVATSPWPVGEAESGRLVLKATSDKIDDLHHATFNGRGAYVSASNTETLETELDNIISEIGVRVGNTAAGASFSSFELIDGEFRFDTSYETASWSGDLEAFSYESATNSFADTPVWSAQSKMALRGGGDGRVRATDRKIITYNGSKGIPFQFSFSTNKNDYRDAGNEGQMSEKQVKDLLALAPHTVPDSIPYKNYQGNGIDELAEIEKNQAYGEVLVNYLRGDNSSDGLSLAGAAALDGSRVTSGGVAFDSGYIFRNRNDRYIGSLIHSQPEFVGAASNSYPDEIESEANLYSTFVETIENRRSMVYVGGNDGMLHGFYAKNKVAPDTSGGEEVFAYVPSMISDTDNGGQGLHKLSSVGYEGAAYVDGSPNVSDVFVNRALEDARWRTYLVGGLRAGGKGIYVLDVTNPNDESGATAAPRLSNAEDITLAERIVVNEFTHEKLGHVYGRPQIGKMNNGRWAAIVGNGYNSSSTEAGTASLFVIYLDKPTEISTDPDTGVVSYQITDTDGDGILNNGNGDYSIITASTGTWVKCADEGGECVLTADAQVRYGAGVNYSYRTEPFEAGTHECSDSLIAASTEDSPVCEYSDSNGLSQPEIVDLDGDGTIDRIYAGDLHGNMWVFKTQNIAANEWQVHSVVDNIPKPLFTACSAALTDGYCDYDQRQPITTKPLVRNNPIRTNSNTEPNKLVFFGTGQYLAKLDPESDVHQSFYTVWDAGTESSGLSKENLTTQYIFLVGDGSDDRLINSSTVNYNTTITRGFGWYYEYLPGDSSGSAGAERVVLSPLLFGNILLFQTLIPNAGLCNASAGSGYIMAVDPLTGGNPPIDIFGRGGDANVAGVKVGSVIVGGSVVKTDDGVELKIKTADGDIGSTNLTPSTSGESGNSTAPGELFHNKGRKSWSILR